VPQPPREGPVAEEIPLEFLHVDQWMAVVNKPAAANNQAVGNN
jgi:23S rRNA-/tRNA-specific pseudouridylate synthase